ncbi:ketoacyl-ACP synthase III [Campylobacter sp. VBCF_06 NA8]|uniref:beta-ketoacyl-ACP synthase III n=1 Tax=Campylobacter sp. VBCF_06 NA8 TaxID=2983822 RepID=UPI0022E9CE84|nr:beta-ketoacyl-ACP synthase III [Campylobacter sp. VBCF_06 NA8]MDA3046842.1 ketoacyl-ACP synthase III [Campylobacter sp. VBCF_06 NA8]
MKASVVSIGAYAPKRVLTNHDLEGMVDTSDEWITQRTGIKERHIADANEATSDMGAKAAALALQRSGLRAEQIDAVLCATITPDYFCMPSTAALIADKLGLKFGIMAFDISAACSGFVYLLDLAKSLIESGAKKHILIVGSEKLSAITDYSDRSTCVLFGDGAGAAVVSASDGEGIIYTNSASDGAKADYLITPAPGSANPISQQILDDKLGFIKMRGQDVYKIAVPTLIKSVEEALEKNNLKSSDIDLFVPHQANLRIIEAVREKIGFTENQCVVTVQKYGNTSSASIPMALNEAYENGRLKNGSLVLLDAFGGGFTWGSVLFKFNA